MNRTRLTIIALTLAFAWPVPSRADVGIGLRMAWVKPNSDVQPPPEARRFTGAMLRGRLSPHTGIELSYDWRTEENVAKTVRTSERPFQGTLLVHLLSGSVSPYLLGGIGWYSTKIETLDAAGKVLATSSDRPFGYHAGFGGEIRAGNHFGLHVDYRYTFVHTEAEVDSGVPLIGAVIEQLGLSRNGSMWTGGATLYF